MTWVVRVFVVIVVVALLASFVLAQVFGPPPIRLPWWSMGISVPVIWFDLWVMSRRRS